MRIIEPAADLAIAIAIASAVSDKPVSTKVAAFGEISLSGEVRGVANLSQRTNEASRLGHKIIIDSTSGQLKKALTQALAQSDQSQQSAS
jgi:DNA repair protein RadA/Sms